MSESYVSWVESGQDQPFAVHAVAIDETATRATSTACGKLIEGDADSCPFGDTLTATRCRLCAAALMNVQ